ncbi:hypothetical protein ACH5RR_037994 [Cinchona calisaya]|uniref:Glycosyltransferase 61 catalytic domain-containing protein n=1 Tax=Cinchona calisaya TaxID=153742 RepID=A0ABD2YCI7_9GENT
MVEESKRVVCSSSFLISLLIFHVLAYSVIFFQIDEWKAKFSFSDSNNHETKLANSNNNLGTATKVKDVAPKKDPLKIMLRRLVTGEKRAQFEETGFAHLSELNSDIYISSKEVRFDTNASRVYIYSDNQELEKYVVQPYPLKNDAVAMKMVKPVEIFHGKIPPPPCDLKHDVPAVVFSSGGFAGNIFHEFNDIIIPLFITSRHFRSRVKFMITDYQLWWINKFRRVLTELSNFEFMDAGSVKTVNGSRTIIHCFPGAIVGLRYHDNLAINISDTPGAYSMVEFRDLLRKSFNLKIRDVSQMLSNKPQLLIISRTRTRTIVNQDAVVKMMEELGFRVYIPSNDLMSNLVEFSRVIGSSSVMLGVHGAGLTNEIFLPNGGVMIQVLPLELDWVANAYYGGPAKGMGLHYLEYKIDPQESTLYDLYGPNHPVIKDPDSIKALGYRKSRVYFLDQQNVTINMGRFRNTLVEAMRLIGRSTTNAPS